MAARNPGQLNVTSEVEASATPPTTGKSDPMTAREGVSPRNRLDSSTLKNGSMACNPGQVKRFPHDRILCLVKDVLHPVQSCSS